MQSVFSRSCRGRRSVPDNNAITRLWTVTGELIEQSGIWINEDDADGLYKKVR